MLVHIAFTDGKELDLHNVTTVDYASDGIFKQELRIIFNNNSDVTVYYNVAFINIELE